MNKQWSAFAPFRISALVVGGQQLRHSTSRLASLHVAFVHTPVPDVSVSSESGAAVLRRSYGALEA